jgi:hypothetical protein
VDKLKLRVEYSLTDTKKALRRIFETAEGSNILYLPPNTNWEIKSRGTRGGEGGTYCKLGGYEKSANFYG